MAIKPCHIIEYQEQTSPTTNNTHSCHHNWQNYHHDVGSSLEVFWWHCIKIGPFDVLARWWEQKVRSYWQQLQWHHHVFSNIHVLGIEWR